MSSRASSSPAADAARPEAAHKARAARMAEASLCVSPDKEGEAAFEDFIDGLSFATAREAGAMKLAGGELLDNLTRYSTPLKKDRIILRAARRASGLYLAFFFKSDDFASYAGGLAKKQSAAGAKAAPFIKPAFDPAIGRWRGIGLRMCRNLSRSLYFRAGELVDRIFVAF